MKILFFIGLVFSVTSTHAAENHDYKISSTFSVNIPYLVTTKADLLSMNTQLFTVSEPNSKNSSQIYVIRNNPPTLANKFSVERYWKMTRAQTEKQDLKEKNYGCARLTSRSFKCSRDVNQDDKFISEGILWNAKNDLVLIRVAALNSFAESRKIFNNVKTKLNTRLPAGSAK